MNADEAERKREQDEIKHYCDRLLQTADVSDVYPTPIDRIVEAAELVKTGDLPLSLIKEEALPQRFWKLIKNSLSDLASIVRAGLFPKEKTIFINPKAPTASIPFVTLHECVHSILPWQQKTFVYLDDEKTLDPQTRYKFEREANFGAGYLLWQGENYIKKGLDMPLNVATPVYLANLFGGSIHSSMRYYVENHKAPVGLLVFQPNSNTSFDLLNRYRLRYFASSINFRERFVDRNFSFKEADINILLTRPSGFDLYWYGEILLDINNETVLFEYSGYETPYNIFILLAQSKITKRYGKPIVILNS